MGRRDAVVAQWEAGVEGLRWLDALLEQGLATQLSFGGYPNRFTALARDVLPQLSTAPPAVGGVPIIGDDYVTMSNWRSEIEINAKHLATCSPDRILTIEAWDQS